MEKIIITNILLIAGSLILTGCFHASPASPLNKVQSSPFTNQKDSGGQVKLTSSAFTDNQPIPALYTCDGNNVNPPFTINNIPANTQSLALIVDDPDAPADDWVHWLVWNIPPTTTEIAQNSIPAGSIQGTTDFGDTKYGGPCPPSGSHRYQFKLFALDTSLNLPATITKKEFLQAIEGHILDQTLLVSTYTRK
ncbi:hypothetical protein A2783_05550 [Microgenomates group bacterium RIFCSPHIGHO2_01_FULL_45_11]|nr:MAG: hypothetical protein A2783_05550 [Microgenomates group bacterium RIFCSPHIGHO2_01_FULL_45_11]